MHVIKLSSKTFGSSYPHSSSVSHLALNTLWNNLVGVAVTVAPGSVAVAVAPGSVAVAVAGLGLPLVVSVGVAVGGVGGVAVAVGVSVAVAPGSVAVAVGGGVAGLGLTLAKALGGPGHEGGGAIGVVGEGGGVGGGMA